MPNWARPAADDGRLVIAMFDHAEIRRYIRQLKTTMTVVAGRVSDLFSSAGLGTVHMAKANFVVMRGPPPQAHTIDTSCKPKGDPPSE